MWREIAADLEATPAVYELFTEVDNEAVVYPAYYLKPFHAYSEAGNQTRPLFGST
jgi:hypothetical protein